jgi:hypothetical protein
LPGNELEFEVMLCPALPWSGAKNLYLTGFRRPGLRPPALAAHPAWHWQTLKQSTVTGGHRDRDGHGHRTVTVTGTYSKMPQCHGHVSDHCQWHWQAAAAAQRPSPAAAARRSA